MYGQTETHWCNFGNNFCSKNGNDLFIWISYNYHHRNVDKQHVSGDEQPPYDFQATAVENVTSVLSVLAKAAGIKISIVSSLYVSPLFP
jgi:hypothetical protein